MEKIELLQRNKQANAAYEEALTPARLPRGRKGHRGYPRAVKEALAAYDEVVKRYGPVESYIN